MPAAHVIIGLSGTFTPIPSFFADGVDTARLAGLKSVADSQKLYGGVLGVGPGGAYNTWIFIRDYYYATDTYPGFFPATILRPVVDQFVSTIGGDALGPDFPAEHIDVAGTVFYRPGPSGDIGYLPAFDNGPFLVLLAWNCYSRGDTSVYAAHLASMLLVLAAAPRDNGLIYSDPLQPSVGWGFEDQQSVDGGMGMVTAYHALAYRRLMEMATAEADAATFATAQAEYLSLYSALELLRRPDGYYNASTTVLKPHVMLTALIASEGLASSSSKRAAAIALLNDYRAVSAFSGGVGSRGGKIAQRGGIRHLVYPNYFSGVTPPGEYQNGASWLGPWTGWVARAISAIDPAAGRELIQDAVDETLRERRVVGSTPWEWLNVAVASTVTSSTPSSGFLMYATDSLAAQSWQLSGVNGSTATLELPYGTKAAGFFVQAGQASTVTVDIEAAPEVNVLADPIPIVSPTFGSYSAVTSVALSAVASQQSDNTPYNSAIYGGRLRATVSAGSATGSLTISANPVVGSPTMSAVVPEDDYSTDRLATDYNVFGSGWVVSGGKLTNTDNALFDMAQFKASGTAADGDWRVTFNTSNINQRRPGFVARGSADGQSGVGVFISATTCTIFEIVAGARVDTGGFSLPFGMQNGVDYELRVRLVGTQIEAWLDGVPTCTGTVSNLPAGYFGPLVNSGFGGDAVSFDNLIIVPPATDELVPNGFIATNTASGHLAGNVFSFVSGVVLRDPLGWPVVTWSGKSAVFSYGTV